MLAALAGERLTYQRCHYQPEKVGSAEVDDQELNNRPSVFHPELFVDHAANTCQFLEVGHGSAAARYHFCGGSCMDTISRKSCSVFSSLANRTHGPYAELLTSVGTVFPATSASSGNLPRTAVRERMSALRLGEVARKADGNTQVAPTTRSPARAQASRSSFLPETRGPA